MTARRAAFTLLELMIVISIICILAGFLFAAGAMAQRAAKINRSSATIHVLATASDAYLAQFRIYPYPNPGLLGTAFKVSPYFKNGAWTVDAYNVTLVWMLSLPRSPEPYLDLNQKWFVKIPESITAPDGRTLYKCVDGFGNTIRVYQVSPSSGATAVTNTSNDLRLTSAGPDGQFGTSTTDLPARDDIEVYLHYDK